jgi:hypothetical protein
MEIVLEMTLGKSPKDYLTTTLLSSLVKWIHLSTEAGVLFD